MRLIDADELYTDEIETADEDYMDIIYPADVYAAPTVNAIVIPQNATNGDMIKALFPNIDFTEMAFTVHAAAKVTSNGVKGSISYDFWKEWWNEPYGKNERCGDDT